MFHSVDPKTLTDNVFSLIGNKWMLITAGSADDCNTMTASWGGLGIIWGAPTATCYIRPQRYTKEYVDREAYFTLTFFGEEYRKALTLCGTKSGRDMDKFKAAGLTPAFAECGAPYVAEGELVLVCRKLYAQDMTEDCFLDRELMEKCYPEKDYHRMYVGEIIEAYRRA